MGKQHIIDGIQVDIANPNLGTGGQGKAELVTLSSDPSVNLVAKHLPLSKDTKSRVAELIKLNLPAFSPFLAAPVAYTSRRDELIHLAPFAEGHDLLSDNRTLPENMELAYHLSCLLTILEEQGVAHGDLAPSNIMISPAGEVYLIDFDNFIAKDKRIPPPTMVGQHMMIAPELRGKRGRKPDQWSDRFAAAVLLNLLLLRRHPAGEAKTPADVDRVMSKGRWPERKHKIEASDVPIQALGSGLISRFDAAFSLRPKHRPSADHWRRSLSDALQNLVIHDCGQAFVLDRATKICPWCEAKLDPVTMPKIENIRISVPSTGQRYRVSLGSGKSIILGRHNLCPAAQTVSGRHLEIMPNGNGITLRHIGRHPSSILRDGNWQAFQETRIALSDLAIAPVTLRLADLYIDIEI